jgi:signal transduction histidine kinase
LSESAELRQRLSFLNLDQADLELLADLRPLLEQHVDSFVEAFYRHLLSFEPTRRLLGDPAVKERLLEMQREYLLGLAGPTPDESYLENRRQIGKAHARIGLEPRWYLGAYAQYFSLFARLLFEIHAGDPDRGLRSMIALQKVLMLDAQLGLEAYMDHHQGALEYLTRELAKEGRRLGRDYEDQGAELRRARQRAKTAEQLASIANLVGGLAHEIGTPMGVIQGHAKMLESMVPDERGLWRLKTIQEQVGRMSKIIQTLLNMARPGKFRRESVALEPLMESALSFLSQKLARRKIEVERSFEPSPEIAGDRERLQQLFLNLFLNAADAMPEGGKLRIALREVDGEDVEVRVGDTGLGVHGEDLLRIFEPFFTTKRGGEGRGLGLMVAKGIVTDHGGSIEVSSSEGEGTEFRMLFPALADAGAPAGEE